MSNRPDTMFGDVRFAVEADVPAMLAINAAVMAQPWSESEWHSMVAKDALFLVLALPIANDLADDPNQAIPLAGYLLARRIADEAELLSIAVKLAYQRRGGASALMRRLVEGLQTSPPCRLILEVSVENTAAASLYERFGFAQVGLRKEYYRVTGREPQDGRLLALQINR